MIDIKENTIKTKRFIHDKFCQKELTNESLVQIIILCSDILNLCTIQQYKEKSGKTYRGIKNSNKIQKVKLFNKIFVIDNE